MSVSEGNAVARSNSVKLTVTLSEPATSAVTVQYALAGVSATAGSDFKSRAKTLTFDVGKWRKTVTVTLYPDTVPEGDETFTLTLSGATGGATIARAVGTGTIRDDDV